MTFTPDIPSSGQTLGGSRTKIVNNFTNYNTVMSVNHVAPNDSGQGKHKFVTMPVQSPVPTCLANEGLIFAKTTNTQSMPYYRRDAGTTNIPILSTKAMAFVSATSGGITFPGTVYNINTAAGQSTRTGVGQYTIKLIINAVSSINVAVHLTPLQNGPVVATYDTPTFSAGVLTIPVKMWKAETAGNFIESSFSITVHEFV